MGQQQLLLVILVVIIVGISTIVAVNILGVGADNSNRDAVRQELLNAASHVQELWERPEMMGGAGKDFTAMDDDVILKRLRFLGSVQDGIVENRNGTYSIVSKEESGIHLRGIPSSDSQNIETYVCYDSENNKWEMVTESPSVSKPAACSE